MKKLKKGQTYVLDELDYPDYSQRDLTKPHEVTWWISKMLPVCMSHLEQNWKPELGVVVVGPAWAISDDALSLAREEDVNRINSLHTVDELEEFIAHLCQ